MKSMESFSVLLGSIRPNSLTVLVSPNLLGTRKRKNVVEDFPLFSLSYESLGYNPELQEETQWTIRVPDGKEETQKSITKINLKMLQYINPYIWISGSRHLVELLVSNHFELCKYICFSAIIYFLGLWSTRGPSFCH